MTLTAGARVATLDAGDGVRFADVWVEVRGERRFDPGAPTALIVGSAIEYEDRAGLAGDVAALQASCGRIAELLARLGFNILNNGCPGLPDFVMRAYGAQPARGLGVELSILKSPRDTGSARAYAPDRFPLSGDVTVFCDAGFEALGPVNAKCADVVVVVGGGLGSLAEAATCVMQGLPVIAYDAHQGVAGEIEPLFSRYLTRFRELRATTCSDLPAMERALAAFAADFRERGRATNLAALVDAIARSATAPERALRISIEAGGASIAYALGGESVRLVAPQVLVDRRRLAQARDADRWLAALTELDRLYEIDGVSLRMTRTQCEAVWGPSIETLLLLTAVRGHLAGAPPPVRILDIGSGAGLLGLWLAAHTGAAVTGLDANPDAVLCANANAAGRAFADRLEFVVGDFRRWRPAAPADLIVSNPPYIAHPRGAPAAPSAVRGVDLLLDVLETGPSHLAAGGAAYVALSSCSRADRRVAAALAAIQRRGAGEPVVSRPTPFKVSAVFHEPDWLRFLLDAGAVIERADGDYAYWHDVEIWRLRPASETEA